MTVVHTTAHLAGLYGGLLLTDHGLGKNAREESASPAEIARSIHWAL
jgi:hypothetical protein